MNDKITPHEPQTVSCDLCLQEIPASTGKTMEADDYIYHFCGIDCYEKWQSKQQDEEK